MREHHLALILSKPAIALFPGLKYILWKYKAT